VLTRSSITGGALALAVALGGRALVGQSGPAAPPYTPEQSMAMLRIEPGFRVELVASEPDVQSPVAMDIDEDGRMWVVEMPGYPLDVSPTGRVKLLEDTNGDGRVDKSTLFADNLRLPSGVMRYKKGLLVTSPPDLLYFEDVNGDGKADTREVVLTGFAKTNPQHAVNHPVFGLDNWIYLAHSGGSEPVIYRDLFGDKGTDLTFAAMPSGKPLDAKGRGVRLKPDQYKIEGLSSRTQYGNAFDVYGHFFSHNNSIHQRHEVIAARYLERNPHLLLPSAMAEISDHGNNNIMPITHGARFDLLTEAGQFTSACALTVYAGGAFPAGYEGTTFIAEPVHNLVHRDVLTPKGSTFVASRARKDMEFLASQDAWFRPVNFYVGPDGALYLIDYYRPYIEHPEWASSDLQKSPDVLSTGKDRGRIYRIVATTGPAANRATATPKLGSASDAQLVEALGSTNVWWRRTAQRLLVHGNRRDAAPALAALAAARPSALARLHALWALEGLDRLEPAHVLPALQDPDPGVRENAIVLAERWLAQPAVATALLAMAGDTHERVRFQLLATLGSLDTPASHTAQEQLLLAGLEDEWVQVAALSASSDRAASYFTRALQPGSPLVSSETPGRAKLFDRIGGVLAARQKADELSRAIGAVTDSRSPAGDWWRASLLEGMARGLSGSSDRRKLSGSQDTLLALATGEQPRVRRAAVTLLGVSGVDPGAATTTALAQASQIAGRTNAPAEARVDAITLLALANAPASQSVFESVIAPNEPEAVQVAGVQALGRIPGAATPTFLLARWPTLSTQVRTAAATVILSRREGSIAMLDALQQGTVKRWMLNFGHTRSLIMHRDEAIRARSRVVLEEAPEARAQRLSRYAAALGGRGDASQGAGVYAKNCAMCHQVDGRNGVEIGPDLSTVRHQPMPVLLANILEPNKSIAQHYETYSVERSSGDPLVGVIGDQSPTSITFRQGPGVTTTVRRSDIKSMTVVPQSIMPESFAEQITPADMAHLLSFLTSPPRGSAP
jgi:putative membrane-bound dehydrogenase-like protein